MGKIAIGQDRGAAGNGRHLTDPRAAHTTGREDAGPLCLLRNSRQHSSTKLVGLPGQEELAEVAVATGAWARLNWSRFDELLKRQSLPVPQIVHRYIAVREALP